MGNREQGIHKPEVTDETREHTAETPLEIPTQKTPDHDTFTPEQEATEVPFWTKRKIGAMAFIAPLIVTGTTYLALKLFENGSEDKSIAPPPTGDRPTTGAALVPGPLETQVSPEKKDFTDARMFFAGDRRGFDETKRFIERRATTPEEALQDVVMLLQNTTNVNIGAEAAQALNTTRERLARDTPELADALVADSGITPDSSAGKLIHDLIKKNIEQGTYATFELQGGKIAGNSLMDGTLIARRLDLGEKDFSKKNDVVEEIEFDFSEKITKLQEKDSPWQYTLDLDKK